MLKFLHISFAMLQESDWEGHRALLGAEELAV
jgi:hypothetical protein